MKFTKILALVISLLLFSTMNTALVSAAESWNIKDGSFETWGTAGETDTWETFTQGDSVVELSSEAAYTGTYGVKLHGIGDGRSNIFQNVGPIPVGTAVKISAYVKIVSMESGGVRLIARHTSMDGSPALALTSFISTTGGAWQEFTATGTVASTENLFIDVTTNTSKNYEIYVDDVTITEYVPDVINGNFNATESATKYQNWTNVLNASQTSPVYVDSERNSNVAYLTAQGYVTQTVAGLKPSTTYRVSFDIKSTAAVGTVKLEWTGGGTNAISSINTNGAWGRYYVDAALGSGTTFNLNILLRLVGSTGTVSYDNVKVEKITLTDECISNGEFEWGIKGETSWTTEGTGTISADRAPFAKTNAIKLSANSGDNYSILQSVYVTHTVDTLYEFSVYAKLSSIGSETSLVQLLMENFKSNGSGGWTAVDAPRILTNLSEMPEGQWMRISMIYPAAATTTRFNIKLRVIGGGTVSFDNASIKPLKNTAIYLAEANGAYTNKFSSATMKVTANVLPKVTEGTENMTMFAAVYLVDNGVTNIHGITEIKTEQISAGSYKTYSFTLNAPDDFNSQNYFIRIFLWDTIQNAVPLMKPIIVTK